MGLKRQLLDAVKAGYPQFNEETGGFVIEFEGSGDSFGSFYTFDIWNGDIGMQGVLEGSFDLNEHSELLYNIIEASGVDYNWNDVGTQGRISYGKTAYVCGENDGVLMIDCNLFFESRAYFEDED